MGGVALPFEKPLRRIEAAAAGWRSVVKSRRGMVRLHRKGDSRYLRHSRIFTRHRKRRALMRFLRGMLGR